MSGTAVPRPGLIAAFKQRRQAYALARAMPQAVDEAIFFVRDGQGRTAAEVIGPLLDATEKNPDAVRIIEARSPGLLAQAREARRRADEQAPHQVDLVRRGQWLTGEGGIETRAEIGKSAMGWHHRVQISTPRHENDPAWSQALPTRAAAEQAAAGAESRAHGSERHPPAERTPPGNHAVLLARAADQRRAAEVAFRHGSPAAGQHMALARAALAEASALRTLAQRQDTPERRPERGMRL